MHNIVSQLERKVIYKADSITYNIANSVSPVVLGFLTNCPVSHSPLVWLWSVSWLAYIYCQKCGIAHIQRIEMVSRNSAKGLLQSCKPEGVAKRHPQDDCSEQFNPQYAVPSLFSSLAWSWGPGTSIPTYRCELPGPTSI